MPVSHHSAVLRAVTLVLLLWAGLDLGAHGLFASDFQPFARSDTAGSLAIQDGTSVQSPDHCFCHSLSLGATLPNPVTRPERTAAVPPSACSKSPRSTARPLFHPPQTLA
jgi:hypothetical protein